MCGGVHNGEVEGLVSLVRWSCSRGLHVLSSERAYLARGTPVPPLSLEHWRYAHRVDWHTACRRCGEGSGERGGCREGRLETAMHLVWGGR